MPKNEKYVLLLLHHSYISLITLYFVVFPCHNPVTIFSKKGYNYRTELYIDNFAIFRLFLLFEVLAAVSKLSHMSTPLFIMHNFQSINYAMVLWHNFST